MSHEVAARNLPVSGRRPERTGPSAAPGPRRGAETQEEERLAPYARKSTRARRRLPLDPEGRAFDYRSAYQRDRDRIIHSRAFRRLRDKRRAHLAGDADPHRTRQTHSLEVSQLGRTLTRALCLNEDLVEAIALGHDLGFPPLGGGGAEALEGFLGGAVRLEGFTPGALRTVGGFEVAAQGLQVVDRLEKRYDHDGINLTDDVRAGIWKQGDPLREEGYPDEEREGLEPGAAASPEAQVVRLACRIAERTDELDDLLRGRPGGLERAEGLGLIRELIRKLGRRYRRSGGRFLRLNQIHRGLTHLLVTAAIRRSRDALERWRAREKVVDSERFYERRGAIPPDVVGLPERLDGLLQELEGFVGSERAGTRELAIARRRGRRVVEGLAHTYYVEPVTLEDYVLLRFREAEGVRYLRDLPAAAVEPEIARHYRGSRRLVRLIGDHVAGMTDMFAAEEHRRLCGAA